MSHESFAACPSKTHMAQIELKSLLQSLITHNWSSTHRWFSHYLITLLTPVIQTGPKTMASLVMFAFGWPQNSRNAPPKKKPKLVQLEERERSTWSKNSLFFFFVRIYRWSTDSGNGKRLTLLVGVTMQRLLTLEGRLWKLFLKCSCISWAKKKKNPMGKE